MEAIVVNSLIPGLGLGLLMAIMLGPVFFMLIHTSMHNGWSAAVWFASGVVLSDALFVLLAYWGGSALGIFQDRSGIIGIGGGIVLIVFALMTWFRKPSLSAEGINREVRKRPAGIWVGKGMMMNAFNPFVLIFWLGISASVISQPGSGRLNHLVFFAAALLVIYSTDLFKAWAAYRIRKVIRPVHILWMNRLAGLGLLLFGLRLIYSTWSEIIK